MRSAARVRDTPRNVASVIIAAAIVLALTTPLLTSFAQVLSVEGSAAVNIWLSDRRVWSLLRSTFAFAATGATVGTLAALALALSLPRSRTLAALVLAIACMPLLVPSSLVGVGWIMALGRDAVITNVLRMILGEATPTTYNWFVAAAETGFRYFGLGVIVLCLSDRQGSVQQAAVRIFQLTATARARLAVTRLASPVIATWLIMFLVVQSDHILPGMFLIHTFGTEVLIQSNALMDPAAAAVIALPAAMLSLLPTVACAHLAKRHRWNSTEDEASPRLKYAFTSAVFRVAAALAILIATVGVPLTGIVFRARSVEALAVAWNASQEERWHSFRLALIGAGITLCVSLLILRALSRGRRRATTFIVVLTLNLMVPASLIALGFLQNRLLPRGFLDSEWPLIIAYTSRFGVIAVLVMGLQWMRISPLASYAASLHGVSRWRQTVAIALPPRLPSIVGSFFLVALLISAEMEMSLILVPPGVTTLGVRLYTLIHTAPDEIVSALAVDVLLVAMLCAAIGIVATRLLQYRMRRTR